METEFKPGDLVVHRSQTNIKMIVMYKENDGLLYCRYYNPITGLFHSNGFNAHELSLVK